MVNQEIYINGLSIVAPGMSDPGQSLSILKGDEVWQPQSLSDLKPAMLPANERRRTTPLIKLALQAMQPLLHDSNDSQRVASVFASSDGDLAIVDKICRALALPEKAVSPTQFHNSVHNAPAGYWAIAASMREASTSISAGDQTFSAAIIEAVTQVITEQKNVLLVAYDVVAPAPLDAARHFEHSLAIALRLGISNESTKVGSISISLDTGKSTTVCQNKSLEALRTGNPIGAGLPLLEALAQHASVPVVIPYVMNQQLVVDVNQQ